MRSRLCAKGEESVREDRWVVPSALRLGPINEDGVSPPALNAGGSYVLLRPPADCLLGLGRPREPWLGVSDSIPALGLRGGLPGEEDWGTGRADLCTGLVLLRVSLRVGAMETTGRDFLALAPSP